MILLNDRGDLRFTSFNLIVQSDQIDFHSFFHLSFFESFALFYHYAMLNSRTVDQLTAFNYAILLLKIESIINSLILNWIYSISYELIMLSFLAVHMSLEAIHFLKRHRSDPYSLISGDKEIKNYKIKRIQR